MLFPLAIAPFFDPGFILEAWEVYLLFFAGPYVASLALWLYARRLALTERSEATPAS